MALDKTGRFEIYEWGSATDPFTRDQMTESHQVLKTRAAGFVTTEESQPDTDLNGYFYYTSTDSSAGILKYSNGVAWFNINESGTVVSLDGTTSDGSGTAFALANHKHALDDNVVTTAKIDDLAVTEGKIADGAVTENKIGSGEVTNAKLASTGLNASKLTEGTLDPARIASGAITNVKLGTDLDAGKLSEGTLDVARIDDGDITNAKLANMNANTVKIRQTSTGVPQNVEIGADRVLGRSGSGTLQSVQIVANMISPGAVTDAKLASTDLDISKFTTGDLDTSLIPNNTITNAQITHMGANTVKVRAAGSSGDPSDLSIAANNVLGRGSSGNLTSTQVERAMIANDAINGDKIANDAVTLGTQTSGNYVKSVSGGSNVTASTSNDGEGGLSLSLGHTSHSGSSSTGSATGTVVTNLTLSNGHVDSFTKYNLDNRYPRVEDTYTEVGGGGYWVQYNTSAPWDGDNAPNGSIYLQYST